MPADRSQLAPFLGRQRIAVFCTTDARGRPHAVPVHFIYHDDGFYIHTDRASVKTRNVAARPFAAIVVAAGQEAVIARGRAEIVGQERFREITRKLIEKYHYPLDEQGRDSFGIPLFDHRRRCVIRLMPEGLRFW
jgi:nitroimidazol reductase NimA-like FMN-containing flavoprotein (pyridoxamine 5'-phosphate oxidase superfamily)